MGLFDLLFGFDDKISKEEEEFRLKEKLREKEEIIKNLQNPRPPWKVHVYNPHPCCDHEDYEDCNLNQNLDQFLRRITSNMEFIDCKSEEKIFPRGEFIQQTLDTLSFVKQSNKYIFNYNELTEKKYNQLKEESDLFLLTKFDCWDFRGNHTFPSDSVIIDSCYEAYGQHPRNYFRDFTTNNLVRTNFLALFQDGSSVQSEAMRSYLGILIMPEDKEFLISEGIGPKYEKIRSEINSH